jgi:hypothetical protein
MTTEKKRSLYEPPRALRLNELQAGRGGWPPTWCQAGSGDTEGCAMDGSSAVGNCAEDGNSPGGSCTALGNSDL